MEQKICPYLRHIDDENVHTDSPDECNACHRIKKPVCVKLSYQKSHCLTEEHTRCAGYITGWETGFPKFLRADYPGWKRAIFDKKVWLISMGIIILFLLVLLIPQIIRNFEDSPQGVINATETAVNTVTYTPESSTQTPRPSPTTRPSNTPTYTQTSTMTPTNTSEPTQTLNPTATNSSGALPFIYLTKTETP